MALGRRVPISKDSPMRAEVYQKLHEFNLHIEQGVNYRSRVAGQRTISLPHLFSETENKGRSFKSRNDTFRRRIHEK